MSLQATSRSHRLRRLLAGQRLAEEQGSSLVEMGITLPIFFLFVFGLINYALVVYGICNITFASRFAGRYACLHSSTSLAPVTTPTLTTFIQPYIFSYPSNTFTTTLTYTGPGAGNVIGNTATVAIHVTYHIVLPFYTYNALQVTSSASGVVVQ